MIRTFVFSQGKLLNRDLPPDLLRLVLYDDDVQVWVDVEKATPEENKILLERVFDFHPLAIEDCLAPSERPKIDDYDNYAFMVIHEVDYINSLHVFQTTELNLFVGRNFLVTHHDDPLRSINSITDRILKPKNGGIARTPAILAYNILDVLFDNYQPALDELSGELAALERRVLVGDTAEILNEIVSLQGEVHRLRQIMGPQREVIGRLIRGEFPKIFHAHLTPYFRDLLDNLFRITDLAETYRESLTSTLQIHLNLQQMQINRVMKMLTVLATLSFPAVAITGFYGMNFDLPEFKIPFWTAHLFVLAVIAVTIAILYWLLKRNDWL
jgi:magnesium transporter